MCDPMSHCHNCMHDTDLEPVESPGGKTYYVCEGCADAVQTGRAMCVAHDKLS